MEKFLKPELLILVPFLIGLGQLFKAKLNLEGRLVPLCLLGTAVLMATGIGFFISPFVGWRLVLDAVLLTGVCHGAVAAFIAMGIYDTARTGTKEG